MSMSGIGREAAVFLCACLSGVAAAFVYQLLVIFRSIISHGYLAINIEDFLYWLGIGVYLFYQMYCTTYGIIRWHFILGVALGFFGSKILIFCASKWLLKMQKRLEKSAKNK